MGQNSSSDQLLSAIQEEDVKKVETLLHSNPKLTSFPSSKSSHPLTLAISKNNLPIVKLLLTSSSSPPPSTIPTSLTTTTSTLHYAIEHSKDDEDIVKLLLTQKIDINHIDSNTSFSPLYYSIILNKFNITKLLLEKKADIELVNSKEETALHVASRQSNIEIVKILIEKKANINVINEKEETPLFLALSSSNGDFSTIQYLLQQNPDLSKRNFADQTLLHKISLQTDAKIASLFLTSEILEQISIESKDKFGETPLFAAAGKGFPSIVSLLLKAKGNIETTDSLGNTPLITAVSHNHLENIAILLKHGANIEHKNQASETAQTVALSKDYKEAAALVSGKSITGEELDNILKINAGGRSDFQFLKDFGTSDIGKPQPTGGPPS